MRRRCGSLRNQQKIPISEMSEIFQRFPSQIWRLRKFQPFLNRIRFSKVFNFYSDVFGRSQTSGQHSCGGEGGWFL